MRGRSPDTPILLSGGNPQIAKAFGEAPVKAWITAAPGWKSAAADRLDALIVQTVPNVQKAVKWNSPLYGTAGNGWFLSMHCYAKFIKIAFFRGAQLKPLPPVGSKTPSTRYLHVVEGEAVDERQFLEWVRQASGLEGVRM